MKLKYGINLGGWISQCAHYEESHYASFIGEDDLARIAALGLDHVRLPVDYNVLEDENGADIPSGWAHLDDGVRWAKAHGLNIIIDLHKARGYDFNDANTEANTLFNSEPLQVSYLALWDKISARYAGEEHVAFELLNEVVEDKAAEPWNKLIARAVAVIRKHAPVATIIYGGICWNSVNTLKLLDKPTDPNVMFTFHFYEPLCFTHQKAGWVATMNMERTVPYPDTMENYRKWSAELLSQGGAVCAPKAEDVGEPLIEELVCEAIKAAEAAGVPLYCGEFGVIDQAPVPDTLRWFREVDKVFRRHQIGQALWTWKLMDFGLIDPHYDEIRDQILDLWLK